MYKLVVISINNGQCKKINAINILNEQKEKKVL